MRPPESVAVEAVSEVGPAWAGHPARFALATHDDHQFVAYFDADRRLTVAGRRLTADSSRAGDTNRGSDADWRKTSLPERVGWDSHNHLALAVDARGHVHLSGNVHNDPLVYFRTTEPLDVTAFGRVDALVGRDEDSVTYPQFLDPPGEELAFMYRDGGSGDGRRLLDAFDPASGEWRRLLETPLLSGGGEMNAYPTGPVRGPDGDYHLAWVWRDTPDAATNHDISYARSPDLVSWERADCTPLSLPITPDAAVVDPVPTGGGVINDNLAVGFDSRGRPVVSYQKFDDRDSGDGATQVYNARWRDGGDGETGEWDRIRVSDWDYRWDVGGRGSIDFEIAVDPVQPCEAGLIQPFWHAEHGPGRWMLDPDTLRPTRTEVPWHGLPDRLRNPEGGADGLDVQWAADDMRVRARSLPSGDAAVRHVLRWESLPANRDREREAVPPPATLRVCALSGW